MKDLSKEQKMKIINAICNFITTLAAIILVSACTMSLSVSKNNNGGTNQTTHQTATADSINFSGPRGTIN